jgi:hypothetical protein
MQDDNTNVPPGGLHAPPPFPPPPAMYQPPPWPEGFWPRVDYLLRNSGDVLLLMREDRHLPALSRTFFVASVLMAAIYGAVMGATNLLQGSPIGMGEKFALVGIVAAKVPSLYLLTLAIVLPPIYVSNAFAGARFAFQRMVCLLLASVAVTSTILASMASVSFFFALTSGSYHFIKLLHVIVFAYAGLVGLSFLVRGVGDMSIVEGRRTPKPVFVLWLLLYMFVGTQLAWVLRPFVGSPNEPFQVFRARNGNFYESVTYSAGQMLRGEDGRD